MSDIGRTSLSANLRDRLGDLSDSAISEAKANPGRAVLIAAGIGYVTGGGLFSPLTARLLGVGLRTALRMLVVPLGQAAVFFACGVLSAAALNPEATTEPRDGAVTDNEQSRETQ